MRHIHIKGGKEWDDNLERFVERPELNLSIEHSLISISEWESKWHKPFLDEKQKTIEESLDYILCTIISPKLTIEDIKKFPKETIKEIDEYINDPMSATTFQDRRNNVINGKKKEIITSEQVYYWMIAYNIPFECRKWHFNRLMNLIKICGIEMEKQNPKSKNKMSKSDILANNKRLNEARRNAWHTKG